MLTDDQIIARGKHAAALLDDPVVLEAQKLTHQEIYEQWTQTRPDDTQTRESLWAQVQAVEKFIQVLNKIRNAGVALEHQKQAEARRKSV